MKKGQSHPAVPNNLSVYKKINVKTAVMLSSPSRLTGGASYQTADGRKSLNLNGQSGSGASVPAFDLPSDITIASWVRVHNPPSQFNPILSDWSSPHKFYFGLERNTADTFVFIIRNAAKSDLVTYANKVTLG